MGIGDGGYRSPVLYTQYNVPTDTLRELNALRSVVETSIGHAANFQFAAQRCRVSPTEQAFLLQLCYELTQWKMYMHPLRPQHLPAAFRQRLRDMAEHDPFGDWEAGIYD
jgi:hypothetical protein